MEQKLHDLKRRLVEIGDLASALAVIQWDESTYMPEGGAPARARQRAALQTVIHSKRTDPELGKLLDSLQAYGESLPYDSDDASLIRVARRDFERNNRIPVAFAAKVAQHGGESFAAWIKARPANDFAAVRPLLEKSLEYSREFAEFFPGYEHVIDPHIALGDYGMKASSIRKVFSELRDQLVPLVQKISAKPLADDSPMRRHFPQAQQLAFGAAVAKQLGYDFTRGRQDLTYHPFCTTFSIGDVRITTRVREDDFGDCFFSIVHEAGHAMYEQGVNPAYESTPLGGGTSAGVHESQSRLWENVVGRSYSFWQHYYPQLQAAFKGTLDDVSLDAFYAAINKVQPSLVRVDADEVTYNLHVMIRFDLEMAMLEGKLAIKDLPEAWHSRYQSNLGIHAPNDSDGVLQDVHWFDGFIGGMFQGYTLGNIMSAQFYAKALEAHPEISSQIQHGEFRTLLTWLQTQIYQHGSKFTTSELLERVTGSRELQIAPYITYLTNKYSTLYGL